MLNDRALTTDLLIKFHREILRWIYDGFPQQEVFSSGFGLCYNLKSWAAENGQSVHYLSLALDAEFVRAGMNDVYPFYMPLLHWEESDYDVARAEYRQERPDHAIFRNERRLHWIRSFAARTLSTENAEFGAEDA